MLGALIVIAGPTATGKSGLASALAHRLHRPILNADSRQVYRHFNIGTAKPSLKEQQQIPHYLIDVCEPTQVFTVADYQEQAMAVLNQMGSLSHGNQGTVDPRVHNESTSIPSSPTPLLVGGTGLYIRSITRGLIIPKVPPHPQLRDQLTALGQGQCYALLTQVDPVAAQKIHPHDVVRTLRGLEVFYVTGKSVSAQQGESPPSFPMLQIGLDCSRDGNNGDPLVYRIQRRTEHMIKEGWVEEVIQLHQWYGSQLPLLKTLGYEEIGRYLQGKISLDEAKEQIILHTRQFAKRQRTWFRSVPLMEWFDCDRPDLLNVVWQRIEQFRTLNGIE